MLGKNWSDKYCLRMVFFVNLEFKFDSYLLVFHQISLLDFIWLLKYFWNSNPNVQYLLNGWIKGKELFISLGSIFQIMKEIYVLRSNLIRHFLGSEVAHLSDYLNELLILIRKIFICCMEIVKVELMKYELNNLRILKIFLYYLYNYFQY